MQHVEWLRNIHSHMLIRLYQCGMCANSLFPSHFVSRARGLILCNGVNSFNLCIAIADEALWHKSFQTAVYCELSACRCCNMLLSSNPRMTLNSILELRLYQHARLYKAQFELYILGAFVGLFLLGVLLKTIKPRAHLSTVSGNITFVCCCFCLQTLFSARLPEVSADCSCSHIFRYIYDTTYAFILCLFLECYYIWHFAT